MTDKELMRLFGVKDDSPIHKYIEMGVLEFVCEPDWDERELICDYAESCNSDGWEESRVRVDDLQAWRVGFRIIVPTKDGREEFYEDDLITICAGEDNQPWPDAVIFKELQADEVIQRAIELVEEMLVYGEDW